MVPVRRCNVCMNAEVGKVTCVLGRNGVGKTTLMKALSGTGASSGDIQWQGKSLNGIAPFDRARQGIAYVPQGGYFAQLTVEESADGILRALPKVSAVSTGNLFVISGAATMLKRRGGDLSGDSNNNWRCPGVIAETKIADSG